ncbi:hypothetical protein A0H81_01132 [Grifola frondosa]|uniref:Uncharacterized protein n=1 Tax=Grifola frondosa TaxID=5627 RepID=A0A1C7MSB6_GRIFR|nr:hypothetical protein A0H81_01132 [Grifola frondosa]
MADFIQALDPSKLVLIETVLSFATSAFDAPVYNLPIFLFGIYAQENSEAIQSLKAFTGLVGGSLIYDIIWMAKHEQNWFVRMLTIMILILKVPTALAFVTALHQRGAQFSGLGFRGNDLSGATVWSMPGGFTSPLGGGARNGYQTVNDPVEPPKPTGGAPPTVNAQPTAPGAYQSV